MSEHAPDAHEPGFAASAHAQSESVAAAEYEPEDQAFIDAVSWDKADAGDFEAPSEAERAQARRVDRREDRHGRDA
jgi:hypothetical protein